MNKLTFGRFADVENCKGFTNSGYYQFQKNNFKITLLKWNFEIIALYVTKFNLLIKNGPKGPAGLSGSG